MAAKIDQPPGGPEPFKEILSKLFAARGWGRTSERHKLEKAWTEAAGPEYAPHTKVLALRRGTLEIEVVGSVLMQELAQFHKRNLLKKLREAGIAANSLRFKAGAG